MNPIARSRLSTLVLVAFALALAALLFVAVSPGGDGQPASASAATKPIKVTIKNFKYSKTPLTVKVGQKVTWTNQDSMEHDVDPTGSTKGAPHSKLLAKGKSYTWTATRKGTFNYICSVHPYMKAKVIVK